MRSLTENDGGGCLEDKFLNVEPAAVHSIIGRPFLVDLEAIQAQQPSGKIAVGL